MFRAGAALFLLLSVTAQAVLPPSSEQPIDKKAAEDFLSLLNKGNHAFRNPCYADELKNRRGLALISMDKAFCSGSLSRDPATNKYYICTDDHCQMDPERPDRLRVMLEPQETWLGFSSKQSLRLAKERWVRQPERDSLCAHILENEFKPEHANVFEIAKTRPQVGESISFFGYPQQKGPFQIFCTYQGRTIVQSSPPRWDLLDSAKCESNALKTGASGSPAIYNGKNIGNLVANDKKDTSQVFFNAYADTDAKKGFPYSEKPSGKVNIENGVNPVTGERYRYEIEYDNGDFKELTVRNLEGRILQQATFEPGNLVKTFQEISPDGTVKETLYKDGKPLDGVRE